MVHCNYLYTVFRRLCVTCMFMKFCYCLFPIIVVIKKTQHFRLRTKSRVDKIPNWTKSRSTKSQIGQNPEWTRSRIGRNPEWTKSRIGQNPEWTKSRIGQNPEVQNPEWDKIPNWTKSRIGQNPEWTKSRIGQNPTVGLHLRALWSEVLACFANCWQKIVISPQEMLANIWHYT